MKSITYMWKLSRDVPGILAYPVLNRHARLPLAINKITMNTRMVLVAQLDLQDSTGISSSGFVVI